jgi:hypothetical protein
MSPNSCLLPHSSQNWTRQSSKGPHGTLCILDFGMTLDVNPTLRYSLLGFVAHLTSEDDKLPEDLVGLGSSNPKLDFARSGALEPLKFFLKQAGQGGADVVRERIIEQFP